MATMNTPLDEGTSKTLRDITPEEATAQSLSLEYTWAEATVTRDEDGEVIGIGYEPTGPAPGSVQAGEEKSRDDIEQVLSRLSTDAATQESWAALTQAQRLETLRVAVLVLVKLAKLVLRRMGNQ